MSKADEAAAIQKALAETVAALRAKAGRSDTVEFLQILRKLDPYALEGEGGLKLPLPMMFADGWDEVLELLIAEASKP